MSHPKSIDEDEREFLAEREAIIMYCGGLTEQEARELAYTCYIHKFRPKMKTWYPLPDAELESELPPVA